MEIEWAELLMKRSSDKSQMEWRKLTNDNLKQKSILFAEYCQTNHRILRDTQLLSSNKQEDF